MLFFDAQNIACLQHMSQKDHILLIHSNKK